MNKFSSPLYANLPQQADRSFLSISLGVILAHLALLVFSYLAINTSPPKITPAAPRLVVQTVVLNERPPPDLAFIEEEPPPLSEPEPVIIASEEAPYEEPVADIAPAEQETPEPAPFHPPAVEPDPPRLEIPPAPQQKPKLPLPSKPKTQPKKPEPQKKTQPKKKQPEPPKPKPAKKAEEKPKKPAPKEKPKPAKALPAPPSKKSEAAKKDAAAEAAQAKRKALFDQAQKEIAKIAPNRDKINSAKNSTVAVADAPTRIGSLQIEALIGDSKDTLTRQEVTYQQTLASRLKSLVRMPEYGEVKIKLTLRRNGTFVKVDVIHAASSANKKHVEKTLPTLAYPEFGNNFEGEAQRTFTITLIND